MRQLIDTFQELRQVFPLQMQVQRRRKRVPEIHVVDNSLTRFVHIENREHVRVGSEVDDRQMLKRLADDKKHTVIVGPVDDDYDDLDDSVCVPLRSVLPISFDCSLTEVYFLGFSWSTKE